MESGLILFWETDVRSACASLGAVLLCAHDHVIQPASKLVVDIRAGQLRDLCRIGENLEQAVEENAESLAVCF